MMERTLTSEPARGMQTGKIVLGGVAAMLAGGAGWWLSTKLRPELVAPSSVQIGRVQPDSKIETGIEIENGGWLPLKIHDITTSCSCTVPGVSELTVKPGDKALLPVRISVPGGDMDHAFRVAFRTNDKQRPIYKGEIHLLAEYGLHLIPEKLLFMQGINPADDSTQTIRAQISKGRPNLKSLTVKSQANYASATVEQVGEREAAIKVTLQEPIINGEFRSGAIVAYQLEGEELAEVEVVVCGMMKEDIKAEPSILQMQLAQSGSESAIQNMPHGHAELETTGFKNGKLHAELRDAKLIVRMDQPFSGPDAGSILIRWPEQNQRLSIPVSIHK